MFNYLYVYMFWFENISNETTKGAMAIWNANEDKTKQKSNEKKNREITVSKNGNFSACQASNRMREKISSVCGKKQK